MGSRARWSRSTPSPPTLPSPARSDAPAPTTCWPSRPTSPRSEVEALFAAAEPAALDRATDLDKGHGRIEERTITVAREVDWLEGARRFPGELRLPDVACVVRVASRTELKVSSGSGPANTSPPDPP